MIEEKNKKEREEKRRETSETSLAKNF